MAIHYGPVFRRADGSRPEVGTTLALCRHGEPGAELGMLTTHEATVSCPACLKALESAGRNDWPRAV